MALDTNLNVAPYFDDFDETKNFHRILFKPALAVQARELTQLQTILQNQIERIGNNIFKNGSVLKGCAVSFYPTLDFVRLQNNLANTSILDVSSLDGSIVVSNTTGLSAKVVAVKAGSETEYPDTNRAYLRYFTTGQDANTDDVKVFQPNEQLDFYQDPLSSNVLILSVNTIANTGSNLPADSGVGISITDGIIFQKGFSIRVDEQLLVVSDANNVGNTCVGFQTNEFIINSDQDESLLDGSLGYRSFNAPGADRLKLVANLVTVSTEEIANTSDFAILAQYVDGLPIIKNEDTQYAILGDSIAKLSNDATGDFVTKPFVVDTIPHVNGNNDLITASISPGIAHVQGYRIETIKTAHVDIRKGSDVDTFTDQITTTNYGSFVVVNELSGVFDFTSCESVDIYDTAQLALTNHRFAGLTPSGSKVGTANLRGINYNNGAPGDPPAQYSVFIFNIKMNSGKSFAAHARSLYFNGSSKGVADIVPWGGKYTVLNTERKQMLNSFGKSSMKTLKDAANNTNTQYVVRTKATTTLAVDGTASVTISSSHAGGTDQLNYGLGVLGDGLDGEFVIVGLAEAQTSNATGNVAINATSMAVIGNGTAFNTQFSPFDYIKIDTNVRRVTSVVNATYMTVDANFGSANTAGKVVKFFPQGHIFNMGDILVGNREIEITSSTGFSIDVGSSVIGNLNTTIPLAVYFDILRSDALPIKKTLFHDLWVKIDAASHPNGTTGPWSLGIPDLYSLDSVYVGTSFANSNPDMVDSFLFDTGQTDTHYGLSSLILRPGQTLSGNNLLVKYSAFSANSSSGIGFFSVDSYPIDDANTANTLAIRTSEIPVYIAENGNYYALRDTIDFRPYATYQANLTQNVALSTTNPSSTFTTFIIDNNNVYVPAPNKTFEADFQAYVGRKDVVYFTTKGFLKVKEGIPSATPKIPDVGKDGMPIVTINVPPYPSPTASELIHNSDANKTSISTIRDTRLSTTSNIMTNRGYTMKDIGVLDQRISRAEYYITLNMLEQAASTLQIPDTNGLDRFKNGIFADPFLNHSLGDISNIEYRISIDPVLGIARPYFTSDLIELEYTSGTSTNITKTGNLLTLPYNSVGFISQPYATKYRSAAPVQYAFFGHLQLFPNFDAFTDTTIAPTTNITINNAQPWQDFANSPFGTQWGDWRTTTSSQILNQTTDSSSTISTNTVRNWNPALGQLGVNQAVETVGTTTTTTVGTTTTNSRSGQKLVIGTSQQTYDLGTYVTDVSVQPYMRSRSIGFVAWGLRPNTKLHAFFDKVNMDSQLATGTVNASSSTIDGLVIQTSGYGANISSNSAGAVAGRFLIPSGIRTGERTFLLCDVDDLTTGNDATTTTASATYVGSSISVTKQSTTLTTINPEIQVQDVAENFSVSTTSTSSTTSTTSNALGTWAFDPLAQAFRIKLPTDLNAPGAFITGIDLFFKKKADAGGVTVYITGTKNGYPDGTNVIPYSKVHKYSADINVSDNATTATTFTFDSPIYLKNNEMYSFVIFPDGGNPDFLVWMAELGHEDVTTGQQVFSQPSIDVAFIGANEQTWTALQDEYIKFNLKRANFTATSGTAKFQNKSADYLNVGTLTYVNNTVTVLPGDKVVASVNTLVSTANSLATGTLSFYNTVKHRIDLNDSTGAFNTLLPTANTIQIHRLVVGNNTLSNSTLIATAPNLGVHNVLLNAVSPRFASIQPAGTKLGFGVTPTSSSYVAGSVETPVLNEIETEFFDFERIVAGRSNEVTHMSSDKSLKFSSYFESDSPYISPVIDVVRNQAVAIGNLIDSKSANLVAEYSNLGTIQTKYISSTVTLAAGQDAEDFQLYLTAYKPQSSEIHVYTKFLSGDDSETINDKAWTKLVVDDASIYSNGTDVSDYREFLYKMPTTVPVEANTCAYANAANSTILTYTSKDGSSHTSFKAFKIKVVLLSDTTARVPRLNDVRSLALQL